MVYQYYHLVQRPTSSANGNACTLPIATNVGFAFVIATTDWIRALISSTKNEKKAHTFENAAASTLSIDASVASIEASEFAKTYNHKNVLRNLRPRLDGRDVP